MNNRGQVIFYTLMLMIVVVLLALALAPIVNQFTTEARNATTETAVGLDCSNASIDDFVKSQCMIVDVTTPYFFFGMIAIALLIIGAKILL
jgi:hypothetical protein